MKIVKSIGKEDLAVVHIGKMSGGKVVEFVESIQPPIPREKKWVLIVSTSSGCPVKCLMCDAGGNYQGKLSKEEIFEQIDFMVDRRFPQRIVPIPKFKIQFARMGEPSFNVSVLNVLNELPMRYDAPGLLPCISTVAPSGTDDFFERLLKIKKEKYSDGHFQLQFSIHTTDEKWRRKLIPIKKWSFDKIAEYGDKFFDEGDRKITLNFALGKGIPLEPKILFDHFSPDRFFIKITPINPTYKAIGNELKSYIDPHFQGDYDVVNELKTLGYDVLISIGELEENQIGSNCGQYGTAYLKAKKSIENKHASYDYWDQKHI